MFEEGATPSRLVRHVLERHEGDVRWTTLARHYFREGFGVPMARISDDTKAWARNDLTHFWLSTDTLHWMAAFRGAPRPGWLGDVAVTDRDARRAQEPVPPHELAAVWPDLDPAVRACVTRLLRQEEESRQQVQILARLAERLQQKLNEAEAARPEQEAAA